jgi:hypothetical protein
VARFNGRLESWDDVFGKLYWNRQRRKVQTESRALEVWARVLDLRDEGHPVNDALFERVAKELCISVGAKTVKNLYQAVERNYRRMGRGYRRIQWVSFPQNPRAKFKRS